MIKSYDLLESYGAYLNFDLVNLAEEHVQRHLLADDLSVKINVLMNKLRLRQFFFEDLADRLVVYMQSVT